MANKTIKQNISKNKTKKGKSSLLQKWTENTKFEFIKKIGEGNYSKVYLVQNKQTNKKTALKMEKNTNIILLKNEATILQNLHLNGCKGIPIIDWFGKIGTHHHGMSMTYFQLSLCEYSFANDDEIFIIFDKMLKVLNEIHCRGVVHCDIKPQNFMIDSNKNIRIIDFGMSHFFVDANRHFLPPKREEENGNEILFGTLNYASIWMHLKYNPYPRDDICSLVFVLFFLLNGKKKLWNNHKSIFLQKKNILQSIELPQKYGWIKRMENWDYTDGMNLLD